MKLRTPETRDEIFSRDGNSSSAPALCNKAEGNTFPLVLAKIIGSNSALGLGFLLTRLFLSLQLGGRQEQRPLLSLG